MKKINLIFNYSMLRRKSQEFLLILMAIILGLAPSYGAFAKIDEETLKKFSQGNILFYDPSSTACDPATITGSQVTVIGDSISVGARSEYDTQLSGIDYTDKTYNGTTYEITQVSKHFAADVSGNSSGLTIAREMEEQGDLRTYVVFALGTNDPGAVTEEKIDALMDLIGTNHKVVLTTNYAYNNQLDYSGNNAAIMAAKEKYQGKIAVADWASEAANHAEYLTSGDSYVHPGAEGSKAFVGLIKQALADFTANSISGVGSNRNYAGVEVWSSAELQAIEANAAIYKEAADKFNFPWQVMAVLHSHETGLRRYNPSNGQGVYQLYSYTAGGTNENRFAPADEISEEEFRRQTLIAAEIVSTMAGDLNDPDNVKLLFFKYNGTAQTYINKAIAMGFSEEEARNGEGSAYVMNRYDAQRDPTSSEMSSLWPGRYVADGVYDPNSTSSGFGAFVQYEALAGSSYCSWGGGTIAETAIYLSWEGAHSHATTDPKPEYVTAMKAVDAWIPPCGSNGECPYYGASCDQFVGTVMRYSGADPNFPIFFGYGLVNYLETHTEMYMKVEHNNDISNLQPGDIFITYKTGNHIYLYVGEIDGQPSQASASWGGRTGEHFPGVYFTDNSGTNGATRVYDVYRRINF